MGPVGAVRDGERLQLHGLPGINEGPFDSTTLKVMKLVAFLVIFAVVEIAGIFEVSRLTDYRLRAIGYSLVSLLLIMPVVAIYNTMIQINEESQGTALYGLRAIVLRQNILQPHPLLIGAPRHLQELEARAPEMDEDNSDIEDEGPANEV